MSEADVERLADIAANAPTLLTRQLAASNMKVALLRLLREAAALRGPASSMSDTNVRLHLVPHPAARDQE
jgi:hypothetical protein